MTKCILTPLVIAPLSEMYGRLPLYHICNVLFIVFTVAAAVAANMSQFIVFRFFMGCETTQHHLCGIY
jgi:MFS family permease